MKASDFELNDPALGAYLAECEKRLRFAEFNSDVAYKLGEFLRARFVRLHDPSQAVYIQIRGFPAHSSCPFVLFAAIAGNGDRIGAGVGFQIEDKARVVEHLGDSTFKTKAFTTIIGWPTEKMGLSPPEHIISNNGFPIRLTNCPTPIRALVVSGLPDVEDHQFIVDSLAEFLGIALD